MKRIVCMVCACISFTVAIVSALMLGISIGQEMQREKCEEWNENVRSEICQYCNGK